MTGELTTPAVLFLVLAGVAAAVDWWAVAGDRRSVEYAAKPAVLVALIGAAILLQPADATVRALFVVAFAWGLLGDVLLMLDRFVPGAAAFLIGHCFAIAALLQVPLHLPWLVTGLLAFGVLAWLVGRPVVRGAAHRSRTLGGIVAVYLVVLGTVLILGVGTAVPQAMAGVTLFAASDALLAYGRFVAPAPGGRVAVHVTYHCAQALLVLALITLA